MTTTGKARVDNAAKLAKAMVRCVLDEDGRLGEPLLGFCNQLVDWVIYGQNEPHGQPTKYVCAVVRKAVQHGLYGEYAAERAQIGAGVRARFVSFL